MKSKGMWKKRLGIFSLVLVFAGALAGCGGGSSSGDVIRIGGNMEMTGGSATYGISGSKGAKLAIKEFNEKGGFKGKKVELVIADNKSEASESANAMQRLVQDGVVAVVGPSLSSSVMAVSQIAGDSHIAVVSPTGTNPRVTVDEKGNLREYIFRATFIDPFQGSVMATFASQTLQAKTAAVYIDNSSDYAKGLAKYFEEEFTKRGGTVVSSEAYLQKDNDFKATLTKIKMANPDVIFVPGYYQEVGLIIKQARDMGITVPIIGGDGWNSAKLVELAGTENLRGCYFSGFFSPEDTDPTAVAFKEAYQKEYGEIPDSFAALSYDSTRMILEAMVRADSVDSVKIRDELKNTKDFSGAAGQITLNSTHDPVKSAVIIEFKEGKQTFKERVSP